MLTISNIHEAYNHMLKWCLHGNKCSPRGLPIREVCTTALCIRNPTFESVRTQDTERNATLADYMQREIELYKSGELHAAAWRDKASKFWWGLRNPDDTINSNYGKLSMMLDDAPGNWEGTNPITQWEWARQCLVYDRDTRQAVMHFNRTCHQWFGNKDFPCTLYGIFSIRENRLSYTVHMRSQDAVKGWPYDVPFFIWQMQTMARDVGVCPGEYRHVVDSLHVYEKDVKLVNRMLGYANN